MKVIFNGIIAKKRRGCGVCGKKRTDSEFVNMKSYTLPSYKKVTFRTGIPVEVNDEDAEFLLELTYTASDGTEKKVFEVA